MLLLFRVFENSDLVSMILHLGSRPSRNGRNKTMSTLKITGLIGLLGAIICGTGEFLLHFDPQARFTGYDFMADISESRLTAGHFFAVCGVSLYFVGMWHIAEMLRPAGAFLGGQFRFSLRCDVDEFARNDRLDCTSSRVGRGHEFGRAVRTETRNVAASHPNYDARDFDYFHQNGAHGKVALPKVDGRYQPDRFVADEFCDLLIDARGRQVHDANRP